MQAPKAPDPRAHITTKQGNGACAAEGLDFRGFLGEIASHGALLIATGAAFTDPETYPATDNTTVEASENPTALTQAIDWAVANAGRGQYAHVDASRIAVWGQSCGGLEAYIAGAHDDRVGHLGIFNSGQLTEAESAAVAGNMTKPIFYFLGGPTDIAYTNVSKRSSLGGPLVGSWELRKEVWTNTNMKRGSEIIAIFQRQHPPSWETTTKATAPRSMISTRVLLASLVRTSCSGFCVGTRPPRTGSRRVAGIVLDS